MHIRLALTRNGSVVTWGGTLTNRATLAVPPDLPPAVAIAAGDDFSVALCADGKVKVWGMGAEDSIAVPEPLPMIVAVAAGPSRVLTQTRVIAITAGGDHSVALRADGTVVAWGADFNGQSTPPMHLHNVIAIAAGKEHSLALVAERALTAHDRAPARRRDDPQFVGGTAGHFQGPSVLSRPAMATVSKVRRCRSTGGLMGHNRNVAHFEAFRGNHKQGGIKRHQPASCGGRHVVAVQRPVRVELFNEGLQLRPLFRVPAVLLK
jgi:alpha-tubulin suppressor-like RCC1 family protein